MAERLGGDFVPLVGGAAHAHALLGALEVLATLEEGAVRERAMHWLDRGDNIRSVSHYQRLMEPYFRMERSHTMMSGICDLVVYVLRRNDMASPV